MDYGSVPRWFSAFVSPSFSAQLSSRHTKHDAVVPKTDPTIIIAVLPVEVFDLLIVVILQWVSMY